jgi:hypothetical protein
LQGACRTSRLDRLRRGRPLAEQRGFELAALVGLGLIHRVPVPVQTFAGQVSEGASAARRSCRFVRIWNVCQFAGLQLCKLRVGPAHPHAHDRKGGAWDPGSGSQPSHLRKRLASETSHLPVVVEGSGSLKCGKNIVVSVLGVAGILAAAALAGHSASPIQLSAKMNSGQEVPNPRGEPVRAGGSFSATLTGTKLTWKLTYSHLSGTGIAAHIHSGAKRKAGPVIVPLCGPCASTSSGTTKVSAAVAKALQGSATYVNVHTKKNPNGEIRGQIGM